MLLCILILIFECLALLFMKVRSPGEFDVALQLGRDFYSSTTDFYSLVVESCLSQAMQL